jgi:hypothetical protein
MLLGRPWLKDAKMAHDWGNNIVTMQGNGIAKEQLQSPNVWEMK